MRPGMFDEDLRIVTREIGEPVTIGQRELVAVVGEIEEGIAQELAGYLPDVTASFTFRAADLNGDVPKAQDKIVYKGKTYRILVPAKSPHGVAIRFECGADGA